MDEAIDGQMSECMTEFPWQYLGPYGQKVDSPGFYSEVYVLSESKGHPQKVTNTL